MAGLAHKLGGVLGRLLLLVVITAATGVLVALQLLPPAAAITDAVAAFERQVLDVPPLPDEEFQPENSFIYDGDGNQLAEISFEQRRIPVTLADIPEITVQAVLSTEDQDFFEHDGINHTAILRAALANQRAGQVEQGGSTLTQQYVENAYLPVGERFTSIDGKITEALWAIEIERRLSKQQILEGYLNRIYLGNGVYGFGTAADYYFSKHVSELDLAESAMLAGMIRSPEGNNPVDNPTNAIQRRNIVLDQMAAQGVVTAEQRDAAKARTVDDMLDVNEVDEYRYPFWVDWVTRLLVSEPAAEGLGTQLQALDAMGASDEERVQAVFQSGLRIHTTLDPELQDLAQAAIEQHLPNKATDPLGGLITVEPGTGRILVMAVGPKDYGECKPGDAGVDEEGRLLCERTKFNPLVPADAGSTRRGRQPGSSFKPFVIAAALEQGVPPGWQINATGPQTIPECDNGGPWKVNNSGGDGLRDMYTGVAGSSNVFHARLIKEIGPPSVVAMAQRLGVTRSPLEPVCALALGAQEVFPLEMATAYATLANRGEYCAPYAIERIEDRNGNVLYQHSENCTQVLERAIADRVVDVMNGPVNPGGTAPSMASDLAPFEVRGKTGTTNDYVDAWFVGYTRQLATASWIGYENGLTSFETEAQARRACGLRESAEFGEVPRCAERRLMRNVTIGGTFRSRVFGGTIPAPMWRTYMLPAMKETGRFEPQPFFKPGPQPIAIVPDLLDVTSIAEAEERVEAVRLNLVVTEVDDYRPAGTVVGQNPPAGTELTAGRAVELLVSNGAGPSPTVPDVVGMGERDAVILLQSRGYEVIRLTKTVKKPQECGIVLAQNPDGGEELEPGNGNSVIIQTGVDEDGGTCGRGVQDGGGNREPQPSESPQPEPSPSETGGEAEPDPEPSPSEGGGRPGNGNGNGNGNGGGGGGGTAADPA